MSLIYVSTDQGPIEIPGFHDPDSILDYGFDYSGGGQVTGLLQSGEEVATSLWTTSTGVTLGTTGIYSPGSTTTQTSVWVIAVDSSIIRFLLTNRITTSQNRSFDFSMIISVNQK